MNRLNALLEQIQPVDQSLREPVQGHLDFLTKPQGSLGKLEDTALRFCLARKTQTPTLTKKKLFTFAGDHGVADAGVSAFPKEVTPQMVVNMAKGGAAINVLARQAGADTQIIDVGVATELPELAGVMNKKIALGSNNFTEGPAMSDDEALKAIMIGAELAAEAAKDGYQLLGTGEMGIGNTTPSSAIISQLLPCDVKTITGKGSGVDQQGIAHKVAVIEAGIAKNHDQLSSPLGVLAALGGFEIAAITGLILGGAANSVPVVVDGFISSAAALVAIRLKPEVRDYLFFSHLSAEAGHRIFAERLEINPLLHLDMRLGEGTGAALAMQIIQSSIAIYNEMATFDSAGISDKE